MDYHEVGVKVRVFAS